MGSMLKRTMSHEFATEREWVGSNSITHTSSASRAFTFRQDVAAIGVELGLSLRLLCFTAG